MNSPAEKSAFTRNVTQNGIKNYRLSFCGVDALASMLRAVLEIMTTSKLGQLGILLCKVCIIVS